MTGEAFEAEGSHSPADLTSEILDCVADGVFTVDREFRVTSFNRAAETITGVPREEALGAYCREVFRAEICEESCALKDTLRSGSPVVNRAVHILRPDGRRVPISVSAAVLRNEAGVVVGGVETFRDLTLVEDLRRELERRTSFRDILSRNPEMQELFRLLPRVARSGSTVLIEGPSGSGKELFARALHDLSGGADGPFVAVNCGAIPEGLLEAELFGHVRGAFTGADRDRAGRLAAATGGTLFLDEVGDMPSALQVKLLRVLEERQYEPLGSNRTSRFDARVVAATNTSLRERVESGAFRQDLFYRLHVIGFSVPPLSRRREDIPLLIDHFLGRLSRIRAKDVSGVSPEALARLLEHDWPGNVRELKNAVEHAFVICPGGVILPEHLPTGLRDTPRESRPPRNLDEAEAAFLRECLARHGGNRAATARSLGIHKTTLWRKMKRLGIP